MARSAGGDNVGGQKKSCSQVGTFLKRIGCGVVELHKDYELEALKREVGT